MTEINDGRLQGNKITSSLLYGEINQLMDRGSMDEGNDERGECNCYGIDQDNGGSRSKIAF